MKKQKRYTCEGKGGIYELVGVAKPEYRLSIPEYFMRLDSTIGAGQSRAESVMVHQGPNKLFLYEISDCFYEVDPVPLVIYKDTQTGQLFHRTQSDFDKRMIKITE